MKRAFTLIEVIISVGILSMLILYMYGSIGMMKQSNQTYERVYNNLSKDTKIHESFFLDFAQSNGLSVKQDEFDRGYLQTSNSHFDIMMPYVSYMVKENILYRIESSKKIPEKINEDMLKYLKFEIVKKDVEKFKLYTSSNGMLVVLDELIFEVGK